VKTSLGWLKNKNAHFNLQEKSSKMLLGDVSIIYSPLRHARPCLFVINTFTAKTKIKTSKGNFLEKKKLTIRVVDNFSLSSRKLAHQKVLRP
jgi:hypothetical protein